MRMIDLRELFAAVEQQREFRRQRCEARVVLQQREQFSAQRRRVDQRVRIAAGGGADHHVADVVGATQRGGVRGCVWVC